MADTPLYDDITISKPIIEMLTVANEYCLFFEKCDNSQADEIISYFLKIAPLLYLKSITLPPLQAKDDSICERFVTEEQWEAVFKALRNIFQHNDTYYIVDQNNDTHEASLADNMADIYQDMKDFVMLFQKGPGYMRENAIIQLQQLMAVRWGPALLNAMKAAHVKYFKNSIEFNSSEADSLW